ncbi:MAG: hypothetical protein IPM63_16465 [Acidobacteriota bacterium]|nr:MAG: hypothetical protein IPM63_16465 [Acidobacteriota bacterium]
MRIDRFTKTLLTLLFTVSVGALTACNPTTGSNNANTNGNLTNTNENTFNTNLNTNANSSAAIEAAEPDEYKATVSISVDTKGDGENASTSKSQIPALQANVARYGENRRMELTMPNGEKLIYLTRDSDQYLLAPARKQYAELDKETLGFEIRKLMMPDDIVDRVKRLEGVERAGEEKYNGRDVVRYTFRNSAETGTQSGEVETESFVLIDKETELPLRLVMDIRSEKGSVSGVSGVKAVTEITNLSTDVDASLFELPEGLDKVEAEEVRSQVQTFIDAAQLVVGQLLQDVQSSEN